MLKMLLRLSLSLPNNFMKSFSLPEGGADEDSKGKEDVEGVDGSGDTAKNADHESSDQNNPVGSFVACML